MNSNQTTTDVRAALERELSRGNGVLRLTPAWVARDFLLPGRRLGLPEDAYDVGERGAICERWLGSTTPADNRVGPADEGLSGIDTDGAGCLLLRDAVAAAPATVMGDEYAAAHPDGLGRLPKLFDYGARLPFHLHPPQRFAALVGRRQKDEAYHFLPDVDLGAHPETFLGVQPWIADGPRDEVLLPHLRSWNSDQILAHSTAYLQVPGEGFDVPSGMLHGPGTALTLELQEDSDVSAMFQALNAGNVISKDLLFKDVRPADRETDGERFPLRFVDWELNGDRDLYAHRHLSPQPIDSGAWGRADWVFYGNPLFSGKRLIVRPGKSVRRTENGVYSLFAWTGSGTWAGQPLQGREPGQDELLVCAEAARSPLTVQNTGSTDLTVYLFFGPDLNPDAPTIAVGR